MGNEFMKYSDQLLKEGLVQVVLVALLFGLALFVIAPAAGINVDNANAPVFLLGVVLGTVSAVMMPAIIELVRRVGYIFYWLFAVVWTLVKHRIEQSSTKN
jgi:phosphatidylserine synthase